MNRTRPSLRSTGTERSSRVVAFQGEPGAFSDEAIRHLRGPETPTLPRRTFEAVRRAVLDGEADLGLLPVENTLAGTVVGAYDALARGGVRVCAETIRPIRHFLLGVESAREGELRRVLSHPVALAQCTDYFEARPGIEAVAVHDTAGAARRVAQANDPTVAAIAPRGAGERYGLSVLRADLQDRSDNQTRFYLIRPGEVRLGGAGEHEGPREKSGEGRREREASVGDGLPGDDAAPGTVQDEAAGDDGSPGSQAGDRIRVRVEGDPPGRGVRAGWRSVLLFRTADRPGALVRVLEPFADHGLNLSKLESRPGGDPWTYRFFLEVDADLRRGRGRAALAVARPHAGELRLLGVFSRLVDAPERAGGEPRPGP